MGRYVGKLVLEWLPDGRLMEIQKPFAFIDSAELHWDVPKKAQIDGASIPRILWSVTGGPYNGKYRDASAVHDWYCSIRTRTWVATHAMFYEAMLTSGVPSRQAKVMYAAVKYAGPRWSTMDTHNTNVATGGRWKPGTPAYRWGPGGVPPAGTKAYDEWLFEQGTWARGRVDLDEFARLAEDILAGRAEPDDAVYSDMSIAGGNVRELSGGLYRFGEDSPL